MKERRREKKEKCLEGGHEGSFPVLQRQLCVYEGKRKCGATDLKMCEVCDNAFTVILLYWYGHPNSGAQKRKFLH